MPHINIGFITDEEYDAEDDYKEYVVIKPIAADKYSFFYTAPSDEGEYMKTTEYNKEQLLTWFRGTFRLAVIAIDSYKAFQLWFPIVPVFTIQPKKLDNEGQFDSLLDLFSEQLDFLENQGPSPSPSPSPEVQEDPEISYSLQEDPSASHIQQEDSSPSPSPSHIQQEDSSPSPNPTPSPIPRRSSRLKQKAARENPFLTLSGSY